PLSPLTGGPPTAAARIGSSPFAASRSNSAPAASARPDSAPDRSTRPEAGCRLPDVRYPMPLTVGRVRTGGEGPVRGLGTALERPQGAGVGVAAVSTGEHTQVRS